MLGEGVLVLENAQIEYKAAFMDATDHRLGQLAKRLRQAFQGCTASVPVGFRLDRQAGAGESVYGECPLPTWLLQATISTNADAFMLAATSGWRRSARARISLSDLANKRSAGIFCSARAGLA